MNEIDPFCVFCSDWGGPGGVCVCHKTQLLGVLSTSCMFNVTSMDKAISRVATLISDERDWLDCPLLHYLMNWLYYLSLSLGCEWCVFWARTGNHSVALDARIIWLMQALSLACRKGSLKRFSLTLIWRLFWLIQIAWSLSSNWSYSKLCPLGVRVSDYPDFS